MTTITNGMSQLEFLNAINANSPNLVPNPCTATQLKNILNAHFSTIGTALSRSFASVNFGNMGLGLIAVLNANFNLSQDVKTVGVGKNYTTISAAIAAATAGDYIVIDAGTYTEKIDLSAKLVHLVGLGNQEVIINYTEAVSATEIHPTLNIGTNSTFKNLTIRKHNNNSVNSKKAILYASACSPVFTDCKIAQAQTDHPVDVAEIKNAATVTMVNCIFDCNGELPGGYDTFSPIRIYDTSVLNFEGTKFKAQVVSEDSSVVTIDADHFWTCTGSGLYAIKAIEQSQVTVTINTQNHGFNQNTDAEVNPWDEVMKIAWLWNDSRFTIHGKLNSQINIVGTNVTCLVKDVIATSGACRITPGYVGGIVNTTVITIDNSHLVYDFADTAIGLHNIEDTMCAEWHIINGSIIEFSGYSGESDTWGQPITINHGLGTGKLYISDSQVIQRCDQKNGYANIISISGILELDNVILTAVGWDGLDTHVCLDLQTWADCKIRATLNNVTFNNDTGGYPVGITVRDGSLDANDYIHASGIINNTGQAMCSNMTNYNLLLTH